MHLPLTPLTLAYASGSEPTASRNSPLAYFSPTLIPLIAVRYIFAARAGAP